jgi:hypothetical protein
MDKRTGLERGDGRERREPVNHDLARASARKVTMLTILLIIIVLLLLFGGGFGYSRRGRRL